ncbi:tRNA (guanosine(37)-N1)-methyltransferase TrmD [Legionella sp. W05-934-2]|uniref:tRNA (guanosine(37)-N1)-methyltransferase TrmD n=1 Tax=Legionella sp. W05-934-2 TaxID=1198649 RepID=UPI003463826E
MVCHLGVISVLPDMFASLQYGVCGKAIDRGLAKIDVFNPRDWTQDVHRQVDDKPYGGGPGMVLMYEPLKAAIGHAKSVMPSDCKTIYLSPQGRVVTQQILNDAAAKNQSLLFLAGRYEGIDERIIAHHIDEEWSIGDFVLSGGELAAMAFIDAIIRLLPGALGHGGSALQDSFMAGLLDYPHYTRPSQVDGYSVPNVLMSGDHQKIGLWRRKQALGKTWLKRPDLLSDLDLSSSDKLLLEEFINEQGG